MSANAPVRPRWVAPALLVAGFGVVIFFSNHAQDTRTPEGAGIIADEGSYTNNINGAYALATPPLKRYEDGAPLSDQDLKDLREAATAVDEANYFKPKAVTPFMLSGMIHLALGDDQKATEKLQQGIANVGTDHSPENLARVIEAHYGLSECYFALQDYKQAYLQAAEASEANMGSPAYLIARAKAALALEAVPGAKQDIAKTMHMDPNALDFQREVKLEVGMALKIAPTYKPALVLGKYLVGPTGAKK